MGRSGQLVRGKVVDAGIQWAKDNNVDLAALPGIRAEVATARATLTAISKQRAFTLANADNFERHLDSLIRLSEAIDRNNRPVIARYQLQLKREYQGDPQTAAYATQAFEVAQEFAKLMVGTAQGDESSRAEARRVIDAALNPEQLRAVAKQLRQNAEQRVQVWDERMKEQSQIINSAAKLKATPAPDDPLGIRR
jgi:cytochrome P450